MTDETLTYADTADHQSFEDTSAPCLVVALESTAPTAEPTRLVLDGVDSVSFGRGKRVVQRSGERRHGHIDVRVPDSWMSSRHARFVYDRGAWWVEDSGSKNGTFVNGIQVQRSRLTNDDVIEVGSTLLIYMANVRVDRTELERTDPRPFRNAPVALSTMSAPLRRRFRSLGRIAHSNVPVLVRGETGTGKELIARSIHEMSGRTGPFIAVNCGALPETLIESELFGYRKGAFSGATESRQGLVRAADGGTLFLDEIAELSEPSQVALLRVLQEREVTPVGGTDAVPVDVRVVAATHQDLAKRMADGTFREDLYARLAGFEMPLPPLRDRRVDVGLIIGALLRRLTSDDGRSVKISRPAARSLLHYGWPMNIRELEHVLQAALAVSKGDEIGAHHLPEPVQWSLREASPRAVAPADLGDDDVRLRGDLIALLETHAGNVSAVARDMGKARVQIRRWCKRFDLDPASYRR